MLNTILYWPKVIFWSCSVIRFSKKCYSMYYSQNLTPSLRPVPMADWETLFSFQFIFILKSHQQAISIDSTPKTNTYWTKTNTPRKLYLGCRCRNSWNLAGHSVPLTRFQNSLRRASIHLRYLQRLLKVEPSLASLCFIFDSQNPHIILGSIENGTSFSQARSCFG